MIRRWFSLEGRVDRRFYLLTGFGLMALKYVIDGGMVYALTGHLLMPWEFLSPLITTRNKLLNDVDDSAVLLLAVVPLPFLWIGVTMSVRRAMDAALSPWLGTLFVLPFVNFVLIGLLALKPTAEVDEWTWPEDRVPTGIDQVTSALFGLLVGLVIAGGMMLLSVFALGEYSAVLFFCTPFVMGAASAYVFNRRVQRKLGATIFVAMCTIGLSCGALLLFALEGIICIAMASPLAMLAGIIGAVIGWNITGHAPTAGLWPLILALPVSSAMNAYAPHELDEREVVTVIEIDAPPSAVWPNVIGFAELPSPPEILFNLGVSYPMRARIDGEGVGAVRHCEFSTGPFVEPITRWDPPARLSFNVASQPAPMHEWSPYRHVHAPHLDGYLRSRRGEFRLVELPGGRTRLEGSTWYTLDLEPSFYWSIYSNALIHMIHQRVLEHIKQLTEDRATRPSAG